MSTYDNSANIDELHDGSLVTHRSIDYFCNVSNAPLTYQQAISSENSPSWKVAMIDEMIALKDTDMYTYVHIYMVYIYVHI